MNGVICIFDVTIHFQNDHLLCSDLRIAEEKEPTMNFVYITRFLIKLTVIETIGN